MNTLNHYKTAKEIGSLFSPTAAFPALVHSVHLVLAYTHTQSKLGTPKCHASFGYAALPFTASFTPQW